MTEEIMEVLNSQVFGVWFLIGAALVFWMQAGFAMVEAGFTRAKNTGNIIMKNLMDFCIGTCTFILIGFSLLLGEDMVGLIGKLRIQPGVLCNNSNNRFRSHGRKNKILILLYLLRCNLRTDLSDRSTLDLGRRLAGSDGIPRFCRILCDPYGRWYLRTDRCQDPWTAYRKIYER